MENVFHNCHIVGMATSPFDVTKKFRELRIRSDLSMNALAKAMGYRGPSSIQRYENPVQFTKRYLPVDIAERFANAVEGRGTPPITKAEVMQLAGIIIEEPQRIPNAAFQGKSARTHDTIPVFGQARGGSDGMFEFNGAEVERIPRPVNLVGVEEAYAVRVAGDSMEPRYFDGELAHVNPQLTPKKGSFVCVQLRGEGASPLAFVKRYVRWGSAGLVLSEYNPEERELAPIPTEQVLSVHVIVGSSID